MDKEKANERYGKFAVVAACGRCLFFVKEPLKNEGQCHRFPPQIVTVSAKTLQGPALVPGAMFPQVGAAWWCAEFRLNPRAETMQAANEGTTKTEEAF